MDDGTFEGSCYAEREYRIKPTNVTRSLRERCAPGYTGKLCAQCAEGYGMKKTGCEYCPPAAEMAGQAGGGGMGFVFALLFILPRLRKNKQLKELAVVLSRVLPNLQQEDLRIMIGVYQVFCSMGMTLNLQFPPAVERLVAFVKGYVSLDLFSLPGWTQLSCELYNVLPQALPTVSVPYFYHGRHIRKLCSQTATNAGEAPCAWAR